MTPVVIERVAAAETRLLRQQVLRPHETLAQLALPDDDPDAGHFVVRAASEVVGTASVRREAPPWLPGLSAGWRLRGTATAARLRGQGVGTHVLAAAVAHVVAHDGTLLWCQARTRAQRFYERAGFTACGEPRVDPAIGPHVPMQLLLSGGG